MARELFLFLKNKPVIARNIISSLDKQMAGQLACLIGELSLSHQLSLPGLLALS